MNVLLKYRKVFVILFLLLTGTLFRAIGQKASSSVLGNEEYITIPFQYNQGFIIVDLIFGYIFPTRFILDTGAEHTILLNKEYIDILKIPLDKEIKVLGADISTDLKAWVVRNVTLQFFEGQKTIQDVIVLQEDVMNLGAITGIKVDGILGSEFLKNFIVEISFKESVIRLYRPEYQRSKWRKFEKIPIELFYNKPYLRTNLSLSGQQLVSNLLLLDTGAALALLLHSDVDSLQHLPSNIIKGVIGKGIGGDVMGYSGKISELTIGTTKFENLITSFQSLDSFVKKDQKVIRDGIVGNFIFDNFHVVFDFPRSQMFLKKRSKRNKPIVYDKSGLVIYAYGDRFKNYYIHHVLENSPASESGFLRGDIVKKVGFWPAKFFSLDAINKKLTKSNKTIQITVKRNQSVLKKTIILRDLYEINKK